MTVFLSPRDWWNEADLGLITREALNRDMVMFLGAMPVRINFCQKDGGTFILKYRRQDLNLDEDDNELKIAGNITTKNGEIAFEGTDSVRIKNVDSDGKKYWNHSDEEDEDDDDEEKSDNRDHAGKNELKSGKRDGKK
jgi:hypothetical protein